MDRHDYPGIYLAASDAARRWQTVHFRLTRASLIALVIVAALDTGREMFAAAAAPLLWVQAALFCAILCTSIILRVGKFDDRWFACRALAENVKRAMWEFVTQPAPSTSENEAKALKRFTEDLAKIRARLPEHTTRLGAFASVSAEVSEPMRRLLKSSTSAKLQSYRENRLDDQLAWYAERARQNAKRDGLWGACVLCVEALGLVLAGSYLAGVIHIGAFGILCTAVAAVTAWSQARRFSDLASSYAMAAEDLRLITAAYCTANGDAGVLRRLVRETEKAVSREHSLWIAKHRREGRGDR